MKRIALILISILLLLALIGCTKYELVGKVDAIVIDKKYNESYSKVVLMPIFNGKTTVMIPRTRQYPEQHLVELKYKDMTIVVDNKELYNNVNNGVIVKVNYYNYKNRAKIEYIK